MNNSHIEKIKKYALLFAFFVISGIILWGASYIILPLKSGTYLNEAEYIVKNSPLCNDLRDVKFKKILNPSSFNMNFCNALLDIRIKDKKAYAAFVNMSGKYGTYQGMFFCFEDGGMLKIRFCGLAGQIAERPASYYGISPFIINTFQKKLDKAFEKYLLEGLEGKEEKNGGK